MFFYTTPKKGGGGANLVITLIDIVSNSCQSLVLKPVGIALKKTSSHAQSFHFNIITKKMISLI